MQQHIGRVRGKGDRTKHAGVRMETFSIILGHQSELSRRVSSCGRQARSVGRAAGLVSEAPLVKAGTCIVRLLVRFQGLFSGHQVCTQAQREAALAGRNDRWQR